MTYPPQLPILNYATPDPRQARWGMPIWVQLIIGFFTAAVVIPAGFTAALFANSLVDPMRSGTIAITMQTSIFVLPVATPLVAALFLGSRWRWPGLLAGVLIFLGLAALGFGLCVALAGM